MIQHDTRSMLTSKAIEVLRRAELINQTLKNDTVFMQKNGTRLREINFEMYSLAALHFAIEKKRKESLSAYIQYFQIRKFLTDYKRFLAILKHLIKS